jgi:hypothetical protein
MRKWGIVISVFYILIVLGLLLPGAMLLAGDTGVYTWHLLSDLRDALKETYIWLPILVVISGQILLLILSVDTSQKRLKPRAHIAVSAAVTSMLVALLMFAAIFSIGFAAQGDSFGDRHLETTAQVLSLAAILWVLWGGFFYLYFRRTTGATTRVVAWLLRGSVLELLIAVPCHVIVRRRHECSAPYVTSFGIATGIAVMLLSFGPGILFIVKKRMDAYATRTAE